MSTFLHPFFPGKRCKRALCLSLSLSLQSPHCELYLPEAITKLLLPWRLLTNRYVDIHEPRYVAAYLYVLERGEESSAA